MNDDPERGRMNACGRHTIRARRAEIRQVRGSSQSGDYLIAKWQPPGCKAINVLNEWRKPKALGMHFRDLGGHAMQD